MKIMHEAGVPKQKPLWQQTKDVGSEFETTNQQGYREEQGLPHFEPLPTAAAAAAHSDDHQKQTEPPHQSATVLDTLQNAPDLSLLLFSDHHPSANQQRNNNDDKKDCLSSGKRLTKGSAFATKKSRRMRQLRFEDELNAALMEDNHHPQQPYSEPTMQSADNLMPHPYPVPTPHHHHHQFKPPTKRSLFPPSPKRPTSRNKRKSPEHTENYKEPDKRSITTNDNDEGDSSEQEKISLLDEPTHQEKEKMAVDAHEEDEGEEGVTPWTTEGAPLGTPDMSPKPMPPPSPPLPPLPMTPEQKPSKTPHPPQTPDRRKKIWKRSSPLQSYETSEEEEEEQEEFRDDFRQAFHSHSSMDTVLRGQLDDAYWHTPKPTLKSTPKSTPKRRPRRRSRNTASVNNLHPERTSPSLISQPPLTKAIDDPEYLLHHSSILGGTTTTTTTGTSGGTSPELTHTDHHYHFPIPRAKARSAIMFVNQHPNGAATATSTSSSTAGGSPFSRPLPSLDANDPRSSMMDNNHGWKQYGMDVMGSMDDYNGEDDDDDDGNDDNAEDFFEGGMDDGDNSQLNGDGGGSEDGMGGNPYGRRGDRGRGRGGSSNGGGSGNEGNGRQSSSDLHALMARLQALENRTDMHELELVALSQGQDSQSQRTQDLLRRTTFIFGGFGVAIFLGFFMFCFLAWIKLRRRRSNRVNANIHRPTSLDHFRDSGMGQPRSMDAFELVVQRERILQQLHRQFLEQARQGSADDFDGLIDHEEGDDSSSSSS